LNFYLIKGLIILQK